MKCNLSLILFFFLAMSFITVAQSDFKEGYIVNNRHERTNCLIRNTGNEESTNDFEYKLGNEPIEKISLSKIEEFGIDGELKCVRALIFVDVSKNYINSIKDTNFHWEEGHAFLKTLIEGELASLYSYHYEGQSLFFFSWEGGAIEPLVHKEYNVGTTPVGYQQILQVNTYQDQLKQHLSCGNSKDAHKILYTKKDLVDYFINYHKCKNSDYQQFKGAHVKKGILLIKPGIHLNKNQLTIKDPIDAATKATFTNEHSVGFGLEAEYILPFNKYAWSFFAEANYLSYSSDRIALDDKQNPTLYDGYTIDYKSIDIPIGLSYGLNFNQKQRLYIKGAFVPHFILADSYIAFNESNKENFSSASRFLVGLGYSFQNVGIEIRYYTPLNITQNILKRGSDFNQLSIRLSYSFQLMGERGVR